MKNLFCVLLLMAISAFAQEVRDNEVNKLRYFVAEILNVDPGLVADGNNRQLNAALSERGRRPSLIDSVLSGVDQKRATVVMVYVNRLALFRWQVVEAGIQHELEIQLRFDSGGSLVETIVATRSITLPKDDEALRSLVLP